MWLLTAAAAAGDGIMRIYAGEANLIDGLEEASVVGKGQEPAGEHNIHLLLACTLPPTQSRADVQRISMVVNLPAQGLSG